VPCYFVQELQRRKVRLEAELTQISHEMQEQCELSQQLLLNVLPHEIIPAFILSENSEEVFAETFSKCSILFANVVGLDLTHQMSTTESVTVLNELICRFDALTDQVRLLCPLDCLRRLPCTAKK